MIERKKEVVYNLNELLPLFISDAGEHMGIQGQDTFLVEGEGLSVVSLVISLHSLLCLDEGGGNAGPFLGWWRHSFFLFRTTVVILTAIGCGYSKSNDCKKAAGVGKRGVV
jgi:hypothetical protein